VPITPAGATADVVEPPAGASSTTADLAALYGVSCLASGPCLSVGAMWLGASTPAGLEDQVSASGVAAASVQAPAPSNANSTSPFAGLASIACSALGACVEIGTALDTAGVYEPYVINDQPPILITNSDPLPAATVGSAYSDTFTATGGWGPGSYTWSATGRPRGGQSHGLGHGLTGTDSDRAFLAGGHAAPAAREAHGCRHCGQR
jgi:hypothetical protein